MQSDDSHEAPVSPPDIPPNATAADPGRETEGPQISPGENPPKGFLVLIALALLGLTWQWWQVTSEQPQPLPWERSPDFPKLYRVPINDADWVEWMQLDSIGEVLAHRIVADREQNGPFESVEDLLRVEGIGPVTLDRIRPHLTIGHDFHTLPRANSSPQ